MRELADLLVEMAGAFVLRSGVPGASRPYHVAVAGDPSLRAAAAAAGGPPDVVRRAEDGVTRTLSFVAAPPAADRDEAALLATELMRITETQDLSARARLIWIARQRQDLRAGVGLVLGPGGAVSDPGELRLAQIAGTGILRADGRALARQHERDWTGCVDWASDEGFDRIVTHEGRLAARVVAAPRFVSDDISRGPRRVATCLDVVPLGPLPDAARELPALASEFSPADRAILAAWLDDAPLDASRRARLRVIRKRLYAPSDLVLRAILRPLV